jgi:hypothetical protein
VSFRGRLTLFFVLIVVVPMVVIAVLATRTADDAARGKADARLFAGLETATAIYEERQAEAREAAERLAADFQLAQAIRGGDAAVARAATRRLAVSREIHALELRGPGDEELASVGGEPFAAAEITLTDDGGAQAGTLTVSTTSRGDYLRAVERLTGREAEIRSADDAAVSLGGRRQPRPLRRAGGGELPLLQPHRGRDRRRDPAPGAAHGAPPAPRARAAGRGNARRRAADRPG